jgi:uncharacterized protein YxeA
MKSKLIGLLALFLTTNLSDLYAKDSNKGNNAIFLECIYRFISDKSNTAYTNKLEIDVANKTVKNWENSEMYEVEKFGKDLIEFSSSFNSDQDGEIRTEITLNRKSGAYSIKTNMFGGLYGNGSCKKTTKPKPVL